MKTFPIHPLVLLTIASIALIGCGDSGGEAPADQLPGSTNQTTFSAPTISGISTGGSQATISWSQTGIAPEGGYDVIINGTLASTQYRSTGSSMAVPGLDLSNSQCFAIEGRFTQADPAVLMRSEQSCTTPPPVTPLDPATVLYVSPDEAIGSCLGITADYGSINNALAAATPGDTVRLLPGIYRSEVAFPHGGTLSHPITLTHTPTSVCTAGGERSAKVDCSTLGNVNCVTTNHGNVIIDGLEVSGAYFNGIKSDGHSLPMAAGVDTVQLKGTTMSMVQTM